MASSKKTCQYPECERKVKAKDACTGHYQQLLRGEWKPLVARRPRNPEPDPEPERALPPFDESGQFHSVRHGARTGGRTVYTKASSEFGRFSDRDTNELMKALMT